MFIQLSNIDPHTLTNPELNQSESATTTSLELVQLWDDVASEGVDDILSQLLERLVCDSVQEPSERGHTLQTPQGAMTCQGRMGEVLETTWHRVSDTHRVSDINRVSDTHRVSDINRVRDINSLILLFLISQHQCFDDYADLRRLQYK